MMLEEMTRDKKRLRASKKSKFPSHGNFQAPFASDVVSHTNEACSDLIAQPGSNTGSPNQAPPKRLRTEAQQEARRIKNRERRKRRGEKKRLLREAEASNVSAKEVAEKPDEEEEDGDEIVERVETPLVVLTREERLAEAEAFVAQMSAEMEEERLIEAAERLRVESKTPGVVLPPAMPVSSLFSVLESVEENMVIDDNDPDKIDWKTPKKE
ncbi:hypothetical protein N7486_006578 [Penicillium sp. IBT 16267x]|nr:hypothetical protein N7486_006578 [Penicillium sp. IBT 16267x]